MKISVEDESAACEVIVVVEVPEWEVEHPERNTYRAKDIPIVQTFACMDGVS